MDSKRLLLKILSQVDLLNNHRTNCGNWVTGCEQVVGSARRKFAETTGAWSTLPQCSQDRGGARPPIRADTTEADALMHHWEKFPQDGLQPSRGEPRPRRSPAAMGRRGTCGRKPPSQEPAQIRRNMWSGMKGV